MANAVSPGTRFRYRCLGPAELRGPAGRALPLRTRKHRALLYVLARKAGAPTSRDVLVDLLWPDAGDARAAKHSLTQSASLINKSLGAEVIVAAGKDLITMREGVLSVDALDFEDHAANGRAEEAFALWGGDLLEGLWVRGAPTFERYLADERERLRRVLRSVLKDLIESRQRSGNWAGMRAAAEKLLDVDPLDEAAMLRYLEALILLDDRTLALRRYGEFEKRLKEELDAEPGEGLRSWVKRQRRGETAGRRGESIHRVSERSGLSITRPVFGRDEEFGILWDRWTAACHGHGTFLVLEGEAGIGKTALVTRLANQATVEGGNVALVRCYAAERAVPFAPVTALVRQLSRLPGFAGSSPVLIGELTRLVPELREQFPGAPKPLPLDELARHRLCDAALGSAEAVASEDALLVIIDDVQNVDEASLALFHYLGRQAEKGGIALVCTIRRDSADQEHVRTFLDTSRRCGFASFVSLGALAALHISRLGQSVLAQRGMHAPEHRLEYIVKAAQGNPLHAIEAALALPPCAVPATDGGAQGRRLGGSSFVDNATGRLAELSEGAKAILAILTVAGRPLSEYEVAAMTGLRPAELEAGLSEGEAAQFLRRSAGMVSFSHDEYAAQAESWLQPAERERAHGELAEHLRSTAARNPATHFEVANHYLKTGRKSEALAEALEAARYAESLGAVRSMASALELALAVAGGNDVASAVRLGECYLALNDTGALSKLEQSLEAMDVDRSGDFIYLRLASAFQSGAFNCEHIARQLADLIARDKGFALRNDACILWARMADKLRDYVTVRMIARQLRREAPRVYGLVSTAYLFTKYYWADRALRLMKEALALARGENRIGLEQFCLEGVAVLLTQVGRFRESARQFDYSLGLARKTMNPQAEVLALNNRAVAEMALGDLDRVERTHAEADRVATAFPSWAFNHYRLYNDALLKLLGARYEDSAEAFSATEAASQRSGNESLWRCAVSGLVIVATRQRDWHRARDHARLVEASARPSDDAACGWIEPTAKAWGACLAGEDPKHELEKLAALCRILARRNVGHWLTLELESIYLHEYITSHRQESRRARLYQQAKQYEAGAIARASAS